MATFVPSGEGSSHETWSCSKRMSFRLACEADATDFALRPDDETLARDLHNGPLLTAARNGVRVVEGDPVPVGAQIVDVDASRLRPPVLRAAPLHLDYLGEDQQRAGHGDGG